MEISRVLNWRYVSTIFLAKCCGDIPLRRRVKNGGYLHFRFLKWPLMQWGMVTLVSGEYMDVCRNMRRLGLNGGFWDGVSIDGLKVNLPWEPHQTYDATGYSNTPSIFGSSIPSSATLFQKQCQARRKS